MIFCIILLLSYKVNRVKTIMMHFNQIKLIHKKNDIHLEYDNYIFFIHHINQLKESLPFFLNPFLSFFQKYFVEKKTKNKIQYLSLLIDNRYIYITVCIIQAPCHEIKNYEDAKNAIGKVITLMQDKKIGSALIFIDKDYETSCHIQKLIESIQVAIILKLYHFDKYINKSEENKKIKINFDLMTNNNEEKVSKGIHDGLVIGDAINFSRYLSDLPASDLYPESFVSYVIEYLDRNKITYKKRIIQGDELITLGMGGIIGVGSGSVKTPRLLILEYNPVESNTESKKVALVGKGVTFDTGGISIKPSEGMEDMKSDMSGAASICASFAALALLHTNQKIIAVAPLAENMVDGDSIRPGDILRFYNGKTAEVKNTDAEGRLVLADALAFVCDKYKPDTIVDLATLTGACRIALGPIYAGLMSEDIKLRNAIQEVGSINGDECWPLPLEDRYSPNMSSDVADFCNIGTKGYRAGATMGGMFLREFVKKDISWAHIDIAPVATDCPYKKYIHSFGATGFGVYLLIDLFR